MQQKRKCVFATASQTAALRGRRALARLGLPASNVRLSPTQTKNGCMSGIATDCDHAAEAEAALREAGIRFGDIIKI